MGEWNLASFSNTLRPTQLLNCLNCHLPSRLYLYAIKIVSIGSVYSTVVPAYSPIIHNLGIHWIYLLFLPSILQSFLSSFIPLSCIFPSDLSSLIHINSSGAQLSSGGFTAWWSRMEKQRCPCFRWWNLLLQPGECRLRQTPSTFTSINFLFDCYLCFYLKIFQYIYSADILDDLYKCYLCWCVSFFPSYIIIRL